MPHEHVIDYLFSNNDIISNGNRTIVSDKTSSMSSDDNDNDDNTVLSKDEF